MASNLLIGAACGIGFCFLFAFSVIAFLDNRYPTRREYTVTLASIDQQLRDIKNTLADKRGD